METPVLELDRFRAAWRPSLLRDRSEQNAGATLQLAPGEWCALIGDNGIGKTTLIQGIAGSCPYVRGSLYALGHKVHDAALMQRFLLGIQYVPHEVFCLGRWTIDDVIQMALRKRPALRYEPAIADFLRSIRKGGLVPTPLMDLEPRLARLLIAILSCPNIILIDEIGPLLNSFPDSVEGYKLVRSLVPSASVIFVEHTTETALKIADKAVVLSASDEIDHPDNLCSKVFLKDDFDKISRCGVESSQNPASSQYASKASLPLLKFEISVREHIALALRASKLNKKLTEELHKKAVKSWPFLNHSKPVELLSGGMKLITQAVMNLLLSGACKLSEGSIQHIHEPNRSLLRDLEAFSSDQMNYHA